MGARRNFCRGGGQNQAHIQKCGLGDECRRHSNGGAEGGDGMGSWEGVSPSPVEVGSGEGALPP